MRRAWIVIVALGLSACDDVPKTWSESDIQAIAEDAAADGAYEMASEVSDRVDQLENRIDELESENARLEREISSLESQILLMPTY